MNETEAPVQTTYPVELNIFVRTPDGFDAHVKVQDVPHARSVKLLLSLSQVLAEGDFTASQRTGSGASRATPAKAADVPQCEICGADVWDNRKNKKNPKAPDFKCKNAECGAGGWLRKDAEVSWRP